MGKGKKPDIADVLNIIPYIPYTIIKDLSLDNCSTFEHNIKSLNGTVLFFDIVQFAPMVFSFIKEGNSGVEDVNKILHEYFTELINPIRGFGGTVYQFAGDSILVGFELLNNETQNQNINRALSSLSEFIMNLEIFNRDYMSKLSREIKFRVGISFGSYSQFVIGCSEHSYKTVITGKAVDEAIKAEHNLLSNEICVTENLLRFKDLEHSKKDNHPGFFILKENYFESIEFRDDIDITKFMKNPYFFHRCKKFLNDDVLKRALSGYEILQSEHREITTLLMNFDGTNYNNTLKESVKNLNKFYRYVQSEADKYGGVLLNPDISDKGNVFIIVFGAPVALESKELLTVQLALKIVKNYKGFKFINSLRCGISTGKAYCGDFGTTIRKDYSIIGNVVNIAARLMTLSKQSGIFIDSRTKNRLKNGHTFKEIKDKNLKGIGSHINIFELLDSESLHHNNENINTGLKIIGRDEELNFLKGRYLAAENYNGNCTGVIAEAGVGKTLLINTFLSKFDISRVNIVYGRCFLYEKSSLYFMWRDFFFNFFKIPQVYDKDIISSLVTKEFINILGEDEIEWIPLLLKLMGLDMNELPLTQSILPEQKESTFLNLICRLIVNKAKEKPLILYFEDIHWIDDKSRLLLKYIISKLAFTNILVIFTSRDNIFSSSLESFSNYTTLEIENLKQDDAIKLIRTILKLGEPNKELEKQIVKSSQCNPFFIDTIVKSIKDNKVLDCDETGTYYIKGNIKDIEIPSSIKNVILSRIDNLETQEQVVIKTASVIGQNFSYPQLFNMLNSEVTNSANIEESLKVLESHDLMNREDFDSITYMFKHMSIRDVIYQTLLQGTKTRLNLVLASYLETSSTDDLFSFSERLALHYYNGEDYKKALFYSIKSAEKAMDLFANNDAITHYQKALEICELLKSDENKTFRIKLELIRIYRLTGQYDLALAMSYECLSCKLDIINKSKLYIEMARVYQEIGDMKKSISICEKALNLLGKKAPDHLFKIYSYIAIQLWFRYINNIPLIRNISYSPETHEKYRLQVDLLSILTKIYYFDKLEKTAWASVIRYNISEHINSTSQLSISATDFGITMVSSGFRKIGLAHLTRGMALIDTINDSRVKAICQSRLALYYLFQGDSKKSIKILDEAISTYKTIGEMWELMTALGTLGQNYYNIDEYDKSIKAYMEADSIAKQLDSLTHQAWRYCKVTFINYLRGDIDYNYAVEQIHKGIKLSNKARDTMNLCISYGHLMEMAILENNNEVIYRLVESIIESNKLYSAELPHIRLSLIYALEGIIKLKNSNYNKNAKMLIRWIDRLSKKYDFLAGPGYRAKSKYYKYKGNTQKAIKFSQKSLSILKRSPYKRDYALSLIHAGDLIPFKKDEYRSKAKEILLSLGLKKEANL